MPQKTLKRIIIYAKDVENITGRKEKAARRLLKKMKEHLGKRPEDLITIQEFCAFTGLNLEEVQQFMYA